MTSTPPPRYRGNAPRAVSRDAKYRVTREEGEWTVELQYTLDSSSYELLTTRDHPDLVEIVNNAKQAVNGAPGGAFYVNEFGQVLVPSTEGDHYLAGTYSELLEFDFQGDVVSSLPPRDLSPGDEWRGPHVGIPYTLTARGDDIRYEAQFANIREQRHLSDEVGKDAASSLAGRLAVHKPSGGRIYINECREFFAPIDGGDAVHYVYLGPLGSDPWYPPPGRP
jgi:hypothetical protein